MLDSNPYRPPIPIEPDQDEGLTKPRLPDTEPNSFFLIMAVNVAALIAMLVVSFLAAVFLAF